MQISELLSPARIACRQDSSSKKRSLEIVSALLADSLPDFTEGEIFDSLISRERLGSTGLGKGFAVPHARLENLEEAHACFVKLDNPINYDAMDHEPVDLIFVLLIPDASTEQHLQILASLARIFSQPNVPDQIRNCHSPDEIISLIEQAEKASNS